MRVPDYGVIIDARDTLYTCSDLMKWVRGDQRISIEKYIATNERFDRYAQYLVFYSAVQRFANSRNYGR